MTYKKKSTLIDKSAFEQKDKKAVAGENQDIDSESSDNPNKDMPSINPVNEMADQSESSVNIKS